LVVSRRFQTAAISLLHTPGLTSFSTIKFWNNYKYGSLIRELGSIQMLNSGRFEAQHKYIKQAYRHTNKQHGTVLDQVMRAF
jgi:hypothetical protein